MNLQEIVEHFPGTKKRIGTKLFVQCSNHKPDTDPSLELSLGANGRLLVHCHAGCSTEDVLASAGLTFADIMPEDISTLGASDEMFLNLLDGNESKSKSSVNGNGKEWVEDYFYVDEFGVVLMKVSRYKPKTFRQFKPHPTMIDKWIPKVADVRRVPYCLPDIMNARIHERIIIVEGEKSANAVRERLGMIATTFLGGAGKWLDSYADFFDKRLVVIVPDNDKPGESHAELIATKLFKTAREVRIVSLKDDLKPGQDIVDWLDAGYNRADFERIILEADVFNGLPLPFVTVGQLMAEDLIVEWTVDKIIPARTGGALVGPSGVGKTWVLLDLALAMTTGGKWLGRFPVKQGTVAIIDEENARPMIQQRIRKLARCRGLDARALADLPLHLLIGKEVDFTPRTVKGQLEFTQDHYKLVESLKTIGADLVIMDSLTRIHRVDENSATEMSNVFASLKNIMKEALCGIMFTHHYNKGEGRSTMNRIRGSSDIRAWCDWTLAIEKSDECPDGTTNMQFEHDKSRYGEPVARFKADLTSVWYDDKQGLNFINRGEIEQGRPPDSVDIWGWIKEQLADDASMTSGALQTLCATMKPGFGLTKLKSELAKRVRHKQLEKEKVGREVLYTLAKDKDADLKDFADAANKK